MKQHEESLAAIRQILNSDANTESKLTQIVSMVNSNYPKCIWVGFYFMNHETQMLHLGPYIGTTTEHTIIPFGKGICGQVAVSGETYVADNVQEESNYIACSLGVQAEIVVPIYDKEVLVAQLDIDSNTLSAFTDVDRMFLEEVCREIGNTIGNEMHLPSFVAQERSNSV
ncbi:GAF domain-containing protein [Owenweeksia hongkongensis DSM 17368]|uniref:GAF domain-containing protein n=1 Tax=Owenweeksia hongkongensis (strain DSM 17368 / CIP 108786 / JCM 12287 / NRRL B-23963 / UST20020801) TaxID=926562 RepID=G8R5W8_OWEHD|nr:GAF domain-containing protein [Owenweeksia hongkongensis]AEV31116.1 GAF domain-containing protein [Owenweeksia hongkongensis DSM 17368]